MIFTAGNIILKQTYIGFSIKSLKPAGVHLNSRKNQASTGLRVMDCDGVHGAKRAEKLLEHVLVTAVQERQSSHKEGPVANLLSSGQDES